MAIIVSRNGRDAKKIDQSRFEKEEHLQKYIYDNPEAIPLYDIKEDIKLLILAREFPTASGPIDAIGIDKEGEIYLVETKLYKNPDKRLVVAQVLDYGASLWRSGFGFDDFIGNLNQEVRKKFAVDMDQRIQSFFGIGEEDLPILFENIHRNLDGGKFKFVVLMDKLHDRLKDLIVFINENSKFDLYAVELEYYRHDEYEILIPKLFGAEVKKDLNVSTSSARYKWTEATLLEDAKTRLSGEDFMAFQKMYSFSKQYADQINLGTGAYASFSPIFNKLSNKSLFSLSTSPNYSFGLNFEWVAKNGREDTAKLLKDKMEALGFTISEDYLNLRPSLSIEEWSPKVEGVIKAFEDMLGNDR
jgi:hypothetical protein